MCSASPQTFYHCLQTGCAALRSPWTCHGSSTSTCSTSQTWRRRGAAKGCGWQRRRRCASTATRGARRVQTAQFLLPAASYVSCRLERRRRGRPPLRVDSPTERILHSAARRGHNGPADGQRSIRRWRSGATTSAGTSVPPSPDMHAASCVQLLSPRTAA